MRACVRACVCVCCSVDASVFLHVESALLESPFKKY